MKSRFFILFSIFVLLQACAASSEKSSPVDSHGIFAKPALERGTRLTIISDMGTIQITATDTNTRKFLLDEDERNVTLAPSENSMKAEIGLYSPVRGLSSRLHDRTVRISLDEALMSYHTMNEPVDFLWRQKFEKPGYDVETIYTDTGLVVQLSKYLKRNKPYPPLDINIWQIYVMGEKPLKMPGSQNEKIRIDRPAGLRNHAETTRQAD